MKQGRNDESDRAGKVVAVVGMHRSGTSCLTGMLEQAGLFLGEVSRKNPFNLKGNCENWVLMALHDEILLQNGGSWDDPPQSVVWSGEHKQIRDSFIAEYAGVPIWGFKDPRTLFLLEDWFEAIPNLLLVGVFRHPLSVAESLQRRNLFPIERGLNLWLLYNQRMMYWHKRYEFPIVSFDHEPFVEKVELLCGFLNLPSRMGSLDFYEPSLRHCNTTNGDVNLPDSVAAVYRALMRIAI